MNVRAIRCFVLGAVCFVLGAGAAFAQEVEPELAKPKKPRAFELRGYFTAGSEKTESPQTFDAVLGKESMMLVGGGAEVVIARRWIVRGQLTKFSDTGTRVFVDTDETVFELGIPLAVDVTVTEFSAGYRLFVKPRWAMYAAAGRSQYDLREESNDERTKSSGGGWHVIGGVEAKPHKWVLLAGEAQWTRTRDILTGGAAQALGESELGGVRFAARIGFGF